jgi:tRNA threonylcarbamoyladenosine biosynthesis protein TsaB
MPAVLDLLQVRGHGFKDVGAVAVATGPGGFSALRVGISTAKGIVAPQEIPLVGISTHDLEVHSACDSETAASKVSEASVVYSVIDAGSSGLAWAAYLPAEIGLGDRLSIAVNQDVTKPEALVKLAGNDALFCGEGASGLAEYVPDSRILSKSPPTRSPEALARLASIRLAAGDHDDPATLEPDYARAPTIAKPKRRQ